MKKLLLSGVSTVLLIGSAGICQAGPYFSGNLAAVIGHDADWIDTTGDTGEVTTDAGYGLSLAMGNDLKDYRVEVELAYRANDLDDITLSGLPSVSIEGDATSIALLCSIYKDFTTTTPVTPYIGAGIGGANVDVEVENILGIIPVGESDDDTVFAYQVALGAAFNLSDTAKIDLSYRYFATTDPDLTDMGMEIEYTTSNIMVGFRMNF